MAHLVVPGDVSLVLRVVPSVRLLTGLCDTPTIFSAESPRGPSDQPAAMPPTPPPRMEPLTHQPVLFLPTLLCQPSSPAIFYIDSFEEYCQIFFRMPLSWDLSDLCLMIRLL